MRIFRFTVAAVILFAAANTFATTFIVPTDEELVAKSTAIVTGTVEGSYVQRSESDIETVYEVRVERSLKGGAARGGELLRVVSPGGVIGDEGVIVPGSAHFDNGEKVLLFLTRDGGKWQPTDLTLGKFRFALSSAGERLLLRDADDSEGWERDGTPHREPVRREGGFLRFIEERVAGRRPAADYHVDAAAVSLPSDTTADRFAGVQTNATYPPKTYTDNVSDGTTYRGIRWPNITAGVVFYKRADQNISGASDGGVSVIQNGLAAWNNECGSVINLQYGGTTTTVSKNFDTVHVVEFNDPQDRVAGSWTGSGTIAITFLSFGSSHSFAGDTWWSMTDADVVFQNGYPATHAAFATAMTHELGHGIGWRHANKHYIRNADYSDAPCDSTVEECTTAAIMNSVANSTYGFTLQPWDVHAAQAVYPGGTCTTCTAPSITSQPQSATISSGSAVTLSVTATGTAPSYQWYIGASGNTANPISGATSATLRVTPASTTSYWVRVSNACGTANSATATITVQSAPPPSGRDAWMDFNGDGKSEMIWRNTANGQFAMWEMNGRTIVNSGLFTTVADNNWRLLGYGDFDADGDDDMFFRHATTGQTSIWLMNGRTIARNAASLQVSDMNWQMHAIGDFNGDGKDELIWRNTATGQVVMWEMNGTTVLNAGVFYTVSDLDWEIQLAGDYNGDGKDELIWRNMATGQLVMWEMNGRTVLTTGAFGPIVSDLNWQLAAVGDYNGDGKDDLFWRNTATGDVSMWEMNGRTVLNSGGMGRVALAWQVERSGDFNGDGRDEIIWWNRNTGEVAMWEVNGHTTLGTGVITQLPALSWRMQPRGGVRPSLTAQ